MVRVVLDSDRYGGHFVARVGSEVIESDRSFEGLLRKLRERGHNPRFVVIDYVPEEPVYYVLGVWVG